jgi:hypothetical protein
MHVYETLRAPAKAAAPPTVKPHAVGAAAPVQHGDFAAGLRVRPHDTNACGTFAAGVSGSFTAAARTIGDFASGTRSSAGPLTTADFATGMRARDDGQRRPAAAARPRSDRERQALRWARA